MPLKPLSHYDDDVETQFDFIPSDDFEGVYKSFFANGQLRYVGYFARFARREGLHILLSQAGSVLEVSTWRDGWRYGVQLEFHEESGSLDQINSFGVLGSRLGASTSQYLKTNGSCIWYVESHESGDRSERMNLAWASARALGEYTDVTYDLPDCDSIACETVRLLPDPEFKSHDRKFLSAQAADFEGMHKLKNDRDSSNGQLIAWWPNGMLKSVSGLHRERVVGASAHYSPTGSVVAEDYYGCNGTVDATGTRVIYEDAKDRLLVKRYISGNQVCAESITSSQLAQFTLLV